MKAESPYPSCHGRPSTRQGEGTEFVAAVMTLVALLVQMREVLFFGSATVAHDTLYWLYPWYHFTAEQILQGRWPWWNPFTHGGEPFYPLLAQLRFFDPLSFLVLFIGSWVTTDLLTLFGWDRFVRGITCVLAAYFLLRPWAEHTITRCSLWPILAFSSFFLGPFRQDAFLGHFIWTGWVMILAFRILSASDYRWRNWIWLAGAIGINWQSYYFGGTWIFLLFFTIGMALFRRELLMKMLGTPKSVLKLGVAAAIIAIMCLPNIVLLLEQDRFVLPARMIDPSEISGMPLGGAQQWEIGPEAVAANSVIMTYEHVAHTGTPSRIMDFLQLLTPLGNHFVTKEGWGVTSEAFMYFGFWVYAGALWGLLAGCHPLKRVWAVIGVGSGLLMLGALGGLHPLLFYLYPPLWFMRHTHGLVLLFSVSLLFFYVLGCNHLLKETTWTAPCLTGWREEFHKWIRLLKGSPWPGVLGAVVSIALAASLNPTTISRLVGHLMKFDTRNAEDPMWSPIEYGVIVLIQSLTVLAGAIVLMRAVRKRPLTDPLWTVTLFPALWVGLAFILRSLSYHEVPFVVGLVIMSAGYFVWWSRRILGTARLFVLLVSSHVAAVFFMHPRLEHLLFIGAVIAIPWIVIKLGRAILNEASAHYMPAAFLLVIVVDLVAYTMQAKELTDCPRPDQVFGFRPALSLSVWPERRNLTSSDDDARGPYGQAIRYQELLWHQPTVFTPLMRLRAEAIPVLAGLRPDLATHLLISRRRWNSYLMLKPYRELIYSGSAPAALRAIFSVDAPLVQFKRRAILLDDEAGLVWLRSMPPGEVGQRLGETILLSPPLYRAGLSKPAQVPAVPEAERAGVKSGAGTDQHQQEAKPFRWTVASYDYNSLVLDVESGEDGYLSWADGYDRYWSAFVDGTAVELFRANLNFKAVKLPKGSHQVQFVYDPWPYRLGVRLFLSMQGSVLLLGLVLWIIEPRPRPSSS